METQLKEPESQSFVETALKMGGKSEEEARTTGTVDRADDQVDALFAARYQTANSPVHRAVWDRKLPVELFLPQQSVTPPKCERTMQKSLETVARHRAQGTLFGSDGKVSQAVLDDLSAAGYWGLLIDPEFGGVGAPFARICPVPGADGNDRAEPRGACFGSRLHRGRRSFANFRNRRAERAVSTQARQRRTAFGFCLDRAVRRLGSDRAANQGAPGRR